MGACIPKKGRKNIKIISNIQNKNSSYNNIKDVSFLATNNITNENVSNIVLNQIDIRKKLNDCIKSTQFNNYIQNSKNKNSKYYSMNIINLSNFNNYTNNIQVKSNKFYVNTYSTNNTDNNENENNLNRINKSDNNIIDSNNIFDLNQIPIKKQSVGEKKLKGPILRILEKYSKKL